MVSSSGENGDDELLPLGSTMEKVYKNVWLG